MKSQLTAVSDPRYMEGFTRNGHLRTRNAVTRPHGPVTQQVLHSIRKRLATTRFALALASFKFRHSDVESRVTKIIDRAE